MYLSLILAINKKTKLMFVHILAFERSFYMRSPNIPAKIVTYIYIMSVFNFLLFFLGEILRLCYYSKGEIYI